MKKTTALALLSCLCSDLYGKELEGTYLPTVNPCPTPAEAAAKMTVPAGYAVKCFAHEPMVQNPVAMTWDHRGRLWVVEAYEYPEGSKHPAPFGIEAKDDQYHPVPAESMPAEDKVPQNLPRDRVVILEDTDNDGTADKRTVFVQGLNLASAILCGDDGIYVGQQPHLLHFTDKDSDDKPDAWRVVLTGFGREDTHELVNSFCWGPDGWLYMTHGVFTNSKVRRPGQPESLGFKFDAGIGRAREMQTFQPASGQTGKSAPPWEFEVFADGTSNPWGCDYDAAGNFFVSACVIDHFFHMAPGGIYVRQGGAPENPYAYEQLPSIVKHKHFRAAYAGIQIYQGGRYPADTHGHAFIGNIHDNAIHEEVLTPVGASFKCEPRRDFLRANDGWFRPVSTQTGPDGFLWVMDWCDKYPCYQNAKANPDGVDRERGRIWRVVHKASEENTNPFEFQYSAIDTSHLSSPGKLTESRVAQPVFKVQDKEAQSRPARDMNLSKLDTSALVKLLQHPNNWMRRMARRMLVENPTEPAKEETIALATTESASVSARMEALWTTGEWGLIARELEVLTRAPQPQLRSWMARQASGNVVRSGGKSVTGEDAEVGLLASQRLAGDADASVRAAMAVLLRQYASKRLTVNRSRPMSVQMEVELTNLIKASSKPEDTYLPFAIWMALEPKFAGDTGRWVPWLAQLAPEAQPLSHTLAYKAMRRLCDTRKAENLDLAIEFLAKVKGHDVLLAHALDGLEKGQESGIIKPTKNYSALFGELSESKDASVRKHAQNLATLWGDAKAIARLMASLLSDKTPEPQRIMDVQTLRRVKDTAVSAAFAQLLKEADKQPKALVVEVIRAAADAGGDVFLAPLIRLSATKDYSSQLAALSALTNRSDWSHAMLDAIGGGKISATGFPVSLRRQLATSKDKAIRDHAFKVLGAWQDSSDDVKSLIAQKKQACLTGEPDLAKGKLLFQGTCMVCHEFHGGGQKVGPDLIGSGRSNLDALLANVIDPNQIIGNGYENVMVQTKDGRSLAGRVVEDTPAHVKLLAAGGAAQIVPREEVAQLTNTKQSLMPMGFGQLPDDAFRDLIWYVLSPPEEGPLTKEKKAALSASIDAGQGEKKKDRWRQIDWESVRLFAPAWQVNAPEFERTPLRLTDYHGKQKVLLLHPFPDKKTPASFSRKLQVTEPELKFSVAADDRGDWELQVSVAGKKVLKQVIDHEAPRWKEVRVDLSQHLGQEVEISLEAHANDWAWEFSYWAGLPE